MADMAYSELNNEWQHTSFLQRVQVGLVQVIKTKIEATPPASLIDLTSYEDKLARSIRDDLSGWAIRFAYFVGMQLIGKATLLDEGVTTDADIFSAINAVYDQMLPSLV